MNTTAPLVAHVVYHFGTGGMENGMVNLFNLLPEDRFRHAVICLSGYSEFRQRIRRTDITFHDLAKQPGHDYSWYARLAALFRELRPTIVHTRNLNALEAQFVAAWLRVPRRVHGEHGRDVFDLAGRNWKYNLLRRAARPLVHQYIAVSQDLAGWLTGTVGVKPSRIAQIYNGVDGDKFHPRRSERLAVAPEGFLAGARFVIGSVGRMAAVKDYASLVRAFIKLCQLVPDASGLRLVIAGDGPHYKECLQMLEAADLSGQAWLPGNRNDTAEILHCLDVFVLPSLGEGISNTILEAMATGLPVVATRVGGNPELVVDGETGSLVPPADPDRLARVLRGYAEDPARCQQEGKLARSRVEKMFTLTRMASAYQCIYESLL